ncbi:MAG: dihydropteroate synthase [Deltaproteobacteria bacterium]|nr:dihydropteroate synthase [Deltaproteobacteria bacterium]
MILIADNLHALNQPIASALRSLDPYPIRELALRCQNAGAKILDLNPGYLSSRYLDRMAFFVETVQEVTNLRLMLDSANPEALARGLAVCQEPPILNALSLEPQKLDRLPALALEYQADLVLLLMDQNSSSPISLEEKLSIAIELRERCLAAGLNTENLIFDPVLPLLRGPDSFYKVGQSLKTVRLLASGIVFQEEVKTMVGLSNLRSGLRRIYPHRVEEICLSMLAGAGLTYVLADVLIPENPAATAIINQMS